ncbi:MAG: penicillin-binding protein 2 [Verrucomicrobia bacterium]|nr:penicillin-binding protein 2 [Verrucomicrobiota bacterium]
MRSVVSLARLASLLALAAPLPAQKPAAAGSTAPRATAPTTAATRPAPAPITPANPLPTATATAATPPPPSIPAFQAAPTGRLPETIPPTWETRSDYRTYYFEIPAPRGLITDRNGVPLAQSRVAHHLSLAFPTGTAMSDAQVVEYARALLPAAANLLGKPLEITTAQLLDHYRERRILPMDLATFLAPEEVERIRPRLPAGLTLRPVYTRVYPQGRLAGHIIGYVGKTGRQADGPIQNNEALWPQLEGREGLEKMYNDKLTGKNGILNMTFDAQGRKVSETVLQPPVPGDNVITTLDAKIQRDCENTLATMAKRGAMVFLDPNNGDVIAMASWPMFDPNMFVPAIAQADFDALDKDPNKPLIPRAFRAMYPAGSTYKVFIGAAALNDGIIRENEEVASPATFTIGNIVMGNSKAKDFGMLNFDRALTMSVNTFFYQVGIRCGADRVIDWSQRFGFGVRTGLPLEGEENGVLPTHDYMRKYHKRRLTDGDVANLSIGQGDLQVTPIQMAQAFATVANGGTRVAVRLVQQIQNVENRVVAAYPPRAIREIGLNRATQQAVRQAMVHVVSGPGGTGGRANIPGVKVAAKTGTAQWGFQEGRDRSGRYAAWFGGFVPAENPKYAFAAIYESERGQSGIHGGRFAAPMIAKVLKENVKPEKPKPKVQEEEEEEEETGDSDNED